MHLQDASPPTAKEIQDYAAFLGLNPDVDEEFLWIAEEALCAPLPGGWSEHFRCVHGYSPCAYETQVDNRFCSEAARTLSVI